MNNNKIIGIVGFVSLFCFIYTASLFAAVFSVLCWILLVQKLFQTDAELQESRKQAETAYKEIRLLKASAETDTAEPDNIRNTGQDSMECLIKRKGMAKDIPDKALFVRKASDQSPRRKVPVRSYRGDEIPGDTAERIDKKFPVVDAETVNIDAEPSVQTAGPDSGKEADNVTGEPNTKTTPLYPGNIYVNEISAGFSEEGYMKTGLDSVKDPEIM